MTIDETSESIRLAQAEESARIADAFKPAEPAPVRPLVMSAAFWKATRRARPRGPAKHVW